MFDVSVHVTLLHCNTVLLRNCTYILTCNIEHKYVRSYLCTLVAFGRHVHVIMYDYGNYGNTLRSIVANYIRS